jgi:hypothetical protein
VITFAAIGIHHELNELLTLPGIVMMTLRRSMSGLMEKLAAIPVRMHSMPRRLESFIESSFAWRTGG